MTDEQFEAWAEQRNAEFEAWVGEHFTWRNSHCEYHAKVQRTEDQWRQLFRESGALDQFDKNFAINTEIHSEPGFFIFFMHIAEDGRHFEPTEGMFIGLSGYMSYC